LVEADLQFRFAGIQTQQAAAAHVAAEQADLEAFADFGAMYLLQVCQAAITQQHAVGGDEVRLIEQ
jgi:hypothetical protein